ncbi:uncharacterized protein LOC132717369 [Ruditapes philippinarum]|uniref:uncharacterized protein LOC132717369 n=1 Tax=Ruditapes philippinarum TaxID=129788 RepID=UPI00295C0B7B|nr:uncharacterized protein LOC132717369 [Ruditapes philippinarum]
MMSDISNKRQEVFLKGKEGSECTINLHGATVTSWKNKGEEILFCSEKALLDGSKAVRGGIPLVFPNFGPWTLGPQHGFARIKKWREDDAASQSGDGACSKVFVLEDDEETRKLWNERFRLEYTVKMEENKLTTSLKIYNKGESAFSFTTLMHTYFRVDDIDKSGVKGLKGVSYDDKVDGGQHVEDRETVRIDKNYDRIYKNCPGPVELIPDVDKPGLSRKLIASNLNDIVVWNPWAEKAKSMSDFGDDEYHNMVCVEAGTVSEQVSLAGNSDVVFSQQIIVVDQHSKM